MKIFFTKSKLFFIQLKSFYYTMKNNFCTRWETFFTIKITFSYAMIIFHTTKNVFLHNQNISLHYQKSFYSKSLFFPINFLHHENIFPTRLKILQWKLFFFIMQKHFCTQNLFYRTKNIFRIRSNIFSKLWDIFFVMKFFLYTRWKGLFSTSSKSIFHHVEKPLHHAIKFFLLK